MATVGLACERCGLLTEHTQGVRERRREGRGCASTCRWSLCAVVLADGKIAGTFLRDFDLELQVHNAETAASKLLHEGVETVTEFQRR